MLHPCALINEPIVKDDHGSHSFNDRHSTWYDAGVVSAPYVDGGGISLQVHGGLFHEERCYRLERNAEPDILSIADATLYATTVIGRGGDAAVVVDEEVVDLAATVIDNVEAIANLKSFYGIDAEHGGSELCVEFPEFWFTQSCRTAFDDAGYHTADGVALIFYFHDEVFHGLGFLNVGTTHGIALCLVEVIMMVIVVERDVAYLRHVALNSDAEVAQCQFSQGTTYTTADCDACR